MKRKDYKKNVGTSHCLALQILQEADHPQTVCLAMTRITYSNFSTRLENSIYSPFVASNHPQPSQRNRFPYLDSKV